MILMKLKALRESKNMTYQEVAELSKLSKEHYWMIENGKRNLSYPNAVKIASAFGKHPDEIFLANELTRAKQEVS